MTQPDNGLPESAWNYGSLSELAGKTRDDFEAELLGRTRNPFVRFLSGWTGILAGITGAANNAVNAITQIGTLIWKVGGSIIDDVGDFINAARSNAQTAITNAAITLANLQGVLNGMVRGWGKVPDAVGSVEDVEVIFGAARQVSFGLITVADLLKAPANADYGKSPNPFEDVAFDRSELRPIDTVTAATATMSASGTSINLASSWSGTIASALNGHRHDVTITTTPTRPRFTIPAGTLALGVVRMTQDRIGNMVRFMAGGDTPAGPLLCGLYKIDPITGDMTLAYDFGDVSTLVATGPILYECALEMAVDLEMIADAGALYAVGILPIGGSFTVGAAHRQPIEPDPIIYPQAATELLAGQSALPASITEASLDHTATHRIWVAFGQALPDTITPVTLVLDFDAYSNNPNWVSPSVKNFGNRWRINDGMLSCTGTATLAPNNLASAFLCLQRCDTPNMFAEFTIGGGWSGESFGQYDRGFVCCSAEGDAGVMVQVHQVGSGNATVTINTITDMLGAGAPQATSAGAFQASPTDVFRIEAVFDEDDGFYTFTALRNGEPIEGAVWADTGNLVNAGQAWRRVGYASTAATYGFSVYRAAAIDVFRGGDLPLTINDPEEEGGP